METAAVEEKRGVQDHQQPPELEGRLCKKCGMTKHPGKFSKPYPDGRPRRTCKKCESERQKKEYKKMERGFIAENGIKKCRTCFSLKPLDGFKYNRQSADRLTKDCVACLSHRPHSVQASGKEARSERLVESCREISITFLQRDSGLFSDIESLAGRERRAMDQQILWILENHFGGEKICP